MVTTLPSPSRERLASDTATQLDEYSHVHSVPSPSNDASRAKRHFVTPATAGDSYDLKIDATDQSWIGHGQEGDWVGVDEEANYGTKSTRQL